MARTKTLFQIAVAVHYKTKAEGADGVSDGIRQGIKSRRKAVKSVEGLVVTSDGPGLFRQVIVVQFEAVTVKTAKRLAVGIMLDLGKRRSVMLSASYAPSGRLSIVETGDLTIEVEGEDVVPDDSDNACYACDEPHTRDSVTCPPDAGGCGELVHGNCIDPKHGLCEVCVGNKDLDDEETPPA